jgi:hypothetical protein
MTRINITKLTKYGQKQSKDTLIINNGMKCPQGNIIFVNLLIHLFVVYLMTTIIINNGMKNPQAKLS